MTIQQLTKHHSTVGAFLASNSLERAPAGRSNPTFFLHRPNESGAILFLFLPPISSFLYQDTLQGWWSSIVSPAIGSYKSGEPHSPRHLCCNEESPGFYCAPIYKTQRCCLMILELKVFDWMNSFNQLLGFQPGRYEQDLRNK